LLIRAKDMSEGGTDRLSPEGTAKKLTPKISRLNLLAIAANL
jgi:hypothetical protein